MTRAQVSQPVRVQRQRSKGWRMPEGAVYVGRPSRWGNPFMAGRVKILRGDDDSRLTCFPKDAGEAVEYFRWFITHADDRVQAARDQLAGRDLACWCPLDQPCHADVLLEIANGATS